MATVASTVEKVEAIRGAMSEDAETMDFVRASVALISEAEEEKTKAETRFLEDLEFGDLEMMELEILCEDLFSIDIKGAEMNLVDTLGDLASLIDRKRGG